MPELPDLTVYREALASRIVGRPLVHVRLCNPFVLRTAVPPIGDAEGRRVDEVHRLGKRLVIALAGERYLVLHLMVAGRLRWLERGAKPPARITLATFEFGEGVLGQRVRTPRPAAFAMRPSDVVILFSDGVAGRFRPDDYPSLGLDTAPTIAFNVVSRFGKGLDDASCAVMRCKW